MEEALTDCLAQVREDLSRLKVVREYLNDNVGTEEPCSVTWRTVEAFNTILSACSSQDTPETDALDTILDSFHYLVRNNQDPNAWNDLGFELGTLCVKILTAIERSEIFEILFCKLLTAINVISEHNSNVWKASARQILNVLINKKFSIPCFEAVLKLYICTLRNIEDFALRNFSLQNLHLLKTMSMLVERSGDFEIQSDIMELIFLHLSNDVKLMSDFFAPGERKLFQSLTFTDFDDDCRVYLNALNKPDGVFERRVYSVCCHVLYFGGCFVEPPIGRNSIWVDANKGSERLSIKCGDLDLDSNRVMYIQFSDIISVEIENKKNEENRCMTIKTKNLSGLQIDVKNNDIFLVAEHGDNFFEFVRFLNDEIKKRKKFQRKISKTRESLVIDRSGGEPRRELQDNAITSSEKPGVDHILPDIFNLFEKPKNDVEFKSSQNLKILSNNNTPPKSQERKVVLESEELSPNSFVESLNKHIGMHSPEMRHTYEDSVETIDFLQKHTPGRGHKLFRSPNKVFDLLKTDEPTNVGFIFDENKENEPKTQRIKTYERTKPKLNVNSPKPTLLRDIKNFVTNCNTQSTDYFRQESSALKKKKPSLPKLKKKTKTKVKETSIQNKTATKCTRKLFNSDEVKNDIKNTSLESRIGTRSKSKQLKSNISQTETQKVRKPTKKNNSEAGKQEILTKVLKPQENRNDKDKPTTKNHEKTKIPEPKSSLLDPNGYAYQRWCKPTTSERSNFWLKKLNELQKPKPDSTNVFEFSDESDSIFGKSKKKRRVVHSKRTHRKKETSSKVLRKSSNTEKAKKSSTPPKPKKKSPTVTALPEPENVDCRSVHNASVGSFKEKEVEEPPEQHKRERSEDSSLTKKHIKKKTKPTLVSTDLSERLEDSSLTKKHIKKNTKPTFVSTDLSELKHRLLEKEKKDRQETDAIIKTVSKVMDHLYNHIQKKEIQKLSSYLNTTEETVMSLSEETEELKLRAKHIQRVLLYYSAGCSVSDMCDSLETKFSKMRTSLNTLTEKRDVHSMINRVNNRLDSLIKSEIDKLVDNELSSKREKIIKCVSMLKTGFGNLV